MRSPLVRLAAAALALAPPCARAEAPPREAPVEVEVLGVVALDAEPSSVLVLRQKGGARLLPIFVGRTEGAAIDGRLKRAAPRRSASDLLDRAIVALGARVTRVDIEGEGAPLFHARVTLRQGDRVLSLEGRPSDAVALAVAARAPIYAARRVLADAGLSREDLERLRPPRAAPDEEQVGAGTVQSF